MPEIRITETGPDLNTFLYLAQTGNERLYSDAILADMCQVAPFPRGLINLDVSTLCNLKCKMCAIWNVHHDSNMEKHLMDFDLFTLALDKIQRFSPNTSIGLTSRGELTCHPRIMDIFSALSERHMQIVFITNGLRLVPSMSQALLRMGLRSITISHDAMTPEAYEAIRGSKIFYTLVENTWELLRAVQGRHRAGKLPFVALNYVKMPENNDETLPFIYYWAPYVSNVNVLKLRDQKGLCVSGQSEPFASMKRY